MAGNSSKNQSHYIFFSFFVWTSGCLLVFLPLSPLQKEWRDRIFQNIQDNGHRWGGSLITIPPVIVAVVRHVCDSLLDLLPHPDGRDPRADGPARHPVPRPREHLQHCYHQHSQGSSSLINSFVWFIYDFEGQCCWKITSNKMDVKFVGFISKWMTTPISISPK